MNKLHKLLIINLLLIMGSNTLKAENLTATRNSETEFVTKNQDLHSHDNFITDDNHVASTLRASAAAAADLIVTIDTGGKVTLKDADGDGYYEISTADELYAFAAAVNGGNRAINGKLTANIVVNQNMLTSDGDLNGDGSDFRAWIPINNSSINGYNGTFDGGEHTVSSLYFNNINTKYVGLFGNVASSGKVANVGVIDTYFNGYSYIGGVVGKNYGTVSGCYNTSTVMGIMNGGGFNTSDYIGGVVGYNSGTVSDCYNNGSVSGIDNIGGVVGDNSGTVSDCYNNGSVSGSVSIGGVVGYNSGIVSGCYNIGNISGNSRIGGVVGYNNNISDDSPAIVTGCYNNGNVSGNNIYVGGIVGDNSDIVRSCYNTGNSSEGGVVGGNRKGGTVTSCYYDSTVHTGNAFYFNLGTATDVLGKTTTQFASGEVAYLLQGEQEENVWGQTIGTDAYPVLGGEKVYRGYESCGDTEPKYTNDENISEEKLEHSGNITYTVNETDNTKHDITYSCCGMVVIEEHVSEKEENKATCKELAVCDHCGESYGELTHTGGTATCTTQAVCEVCGESYGEIDPNNHEYENNNGFCNVCDTHQPATLVTNENYESLGLAAEYVGFYQIGNAGQLYWFANHINTVDRTASAVLTADIDLEGKSDGTGRKWTPIGSTGENSHNFRGHFDGRNHTITNLYVDMQRAGLGFFGEVRLGVVENFTIYGDVKLTSDCSYVGGVIGSAPGANGTDVPDHNGATVRNITSYVNVTLDEGSHGSSFVGGFMGYANHETIIENCSWYGTLDLGANRADSGVGGFIGRLYDTSDVTVRNCAAYGTIKTAYKSGTFENYSTIYIGGFLSYSPAGAQTVLENNLWAGEIINNTDLEASNAHLSAFGTMTSFQSITNCYALNSTPYVTTNNENDNDITTVTAERLASGEIAYLLQGEQETQVWGQNIDNGETADAYPVLGGAKVYKHTFDFGNINVYSNLETLDMTPHGKCGDYLYWNITDSTLTIFGTGAMYDYSHSGNQVSPWKNINPKPTSLILEEGMTSIGEYAFYNCSTLSGNLIFPSTVTNIGKYAFYNCNKLSGDLTIPNSVTSIGKTAFYGCSGLDGVLTISNNITAINEETFTNCYNLTGDLIIPDGVTYIGKKAFYNCNKLSGNLIIPSGVTSIETETFYRCYALSGNLTIPGNVVSIGTYAFQDCNGFTSLTIEEGVQTIAGSAFYGCSGMKGNLRIPNSVTSIGSRAFYSCGLDGELIISHCITSIGDFVFYGTKFSNLVFEDLPDKKSQLTSIGSSAFYMCSSLNNELIIPNSVTSIGTSAFNGCTKLTSIFMYRESALDIGTNAFNKTNSATIYAPVIWSSFDNIPETQLVKMPTYTSQQVNETTSQQVWVGLAEGQTEPGENEHVAINAPLLLSQRDNETTSQQVNSLRVKSFGYCGDGTTINGSITIEEGGQLYCETARGEVTVRKEIIGYAGQQITDNGQQTSWYTIASPLKEVIDLSNSNTFITSTPFDLYRYDEPSHTWQNAKPGEGSTNFQTIESGRGYLYANAENTTLEFKGNINTEDVNYTLTAQGEVLNGFHLVGNPYTHDISFNHLSTDAELANGYYVLNGEGAWGATLGNEGDVIKVGQGALIKTTSDGTLTIGKELRATSNEQKRNGSKLKAQS